MISLCRQSYTVFQSICLIGLDVIQVKLLRITQPNEHKNFVYNPICISYSNLYSLVTQCVSTLYKMNKIYIYNNIQYFITLFPTIIELS